MDISKESIELPKLPWGVKPFRTPLEFSSKLNTAFKYFEILKPLQQWQLGSLWKLFKPRNLDLLSKLSIQCWKSETFATRLTTKSWTNMLSRSNLKSFWEFWARLKHHVKLHDQKFLQKFGSPDAFPYWPTIDPTNKNRSSEISWRRAAGQGSRLWQPWAASKSRAMQTWKKIRRKIYRSNFGSKCWYIFLKVGICHKIIPFLRSKNHAAIAIVYMVSKLPISWCHCQARPVERSFRARLVPAFPGGKGSRWPSGFPTRPDFWQKHVRTSSGKCDDWFVGNSFVAFSATATVQ